MMRRDTLLRSTWAIPIVLAILTCLGLVSALAGDGLADVPAWIGLALPIAATAWALRVQRH